METKRSISKRTSARNSRSRSAPPVAPPLIPSAEIADSEVVFVLDKMRQLLRHAISDAMLSRQVAAFGKAMKWQTDADRPAYLQQLSRDISERQFAEPVVIEAIRRLRETEIWMPAISEVLHVCELVYVEARRYLRGLQKRLDDTALLVKQADREIRELMDDAAYRRLEMAEYQVSMVERRRESIAAQKRELAELERVLARIEPTIEQKYAGTEWLGYMLKWRNQSRSKIAEERADIARREADLQELEARLKRENLQLPAPTPAPRSSFRVSADGRVTEIDPETEPDRGF